METWDQHLGHHSRHWWTTDTPQSALSSSFQASQLQLQSCSSSGPALVAAVRLESRNISGISTPESVSALNSKASQAPAHAWASRCSRTSKSIVVSSGSPCWGFPRWLMAPMVPLAVPIEWQQSIGRINCCSAPLTQRNNMLFLFLTSRLPSAGILRRLSLLHFSGKWTPLEKQEFEVNMRVFRDFVSEQEELHLIQEIEPHLRRLPYESSHWDDAIHGYRETERRDWSPTNRCVLDRVSRSAFNGQVMPHVHILDLAEEGVIKPHVDSARFCGHTIAGLSLLSECVMRLVKVTAQEGAKKDSDSDSNSERRVADLLLPRRSLYIMSHVARYQFTHEVLAREQSWFGNKRVTKRRRLSVICRNEP